MKQCIAVLACCLLTAQFCLCEPPQERNIKKGEVPNAILVAFEKKYPNAKIRGFSIEKDGDKLVYEMESAEGKMIRDVTYTSDGEVVSVEETLPFSRFPDAVRTALMKEFPDAKISKSEKMTKGSAVHY